MTFRKWRTFFSNYLEIFHFLHKSNEARKADRRALHRCKQEVFPGHDAACCWWQMMWWGTVICHSCHSSFIGTTTENRPPSAGICWQLGETKCRRFTCATSPSISLSLHFLPAHSEIILAPHSAAHTTFGFLPGTCWTPCRGGASSVCVCQWKSKADKDVRDVRGKMCGSVPSFVCCALYHWVIFGSLVVRLSFYQLNVVGLGDEKLWKFKLTQFFPPAGCCHQPLYPVNTKPTGHISHCRDKRLRLQFS